SAALVIEIGHLLEAAEGHGGGEGGDDQAAAQSRREFDRRLGERRDVGRDRQRGNAYVLELVMLALMADTLLAGGPELAHQLHAFIENRLVVGEVDAE